MPIAENSNSGADWTALDAFKYRDERETIAGLLADPPLSPSERPPVERSAIALVKATRENACRQGVVQSFLQEFSLTTPEGLALMGLAEALLRTPDANTQDRLIAEKIAAADWASHLGQSDSLLVNASTWGLMLTGRLIDVNGMDDVTGTIRKLAARVGEPIVRTAVAQAMRIMGEQFVLGRTIETAMARAAKDGSICSFDMLGEGARTEADAVRYEAAYAHAIAAIGKVSNGPEHSHGISVKLSALSPRYEAVQEAVVWNRALSPPGPAGGHGGRSRHQPHPGCRGIRPAGAVAQALGSAGAGKIAGGLARVGLGGAGLSKARAAGDCILGETCPRLRPPPDGAVGQGRLLGQ